MNKNITDLLQSKVDILEDVDLRNAKGIFNTCMNMSKF